MGLPPTRIMLGPGDRRDPPRRHLVRTPGRVEASRAGVGEAARQGDCPAVGLYHLRKWAFALVTDRVDPSNAEWRPEPWVRFWASLASSSTRARPRSTSACPLRPGRSCGPRTAERCSSTPT